MWNGQIKSGISAAIFSVALFASLGLIGCGEAGGGGQPVLLAPAGATSPTTTTSATPDSVPPTVSTTSPAKAAGSVSTNSSVSATFSEPMTNSTLNTASFTLVTTPGGAAVTGTVSVSGNTATFTPSAALATSTQYTATVAAGVTDTAGNPLAADFTWSFTTAAAPASGANFTTRCTQPGVIKCVGFDSNADLGDTSNWGANNYGKNFGVIMNGAPNVRDPAAVMPVIDTSQSASGGGSLKFTISSLSGAGSSGQYWTNFSSDLSVKFGENSEFYVQWRQRFSPEAISTFYNLSEGLKQAIITTGDKLLQPYGSCEPIEVVTQTYYQNRFPNMYNSCTGSTHHGPYDPFHEAIPGFDYKLQNARPSPFCLYSQKPNGYFPPTGNCFGWFPNEWMTFQIKIKTGPRVGDEFANSYVTLWMAREGQASEMVINWGPYYLSAGSLAEDQKYGKVFLLPYQTQKDPTQVHPFAYIWYDELIISRNLIADPAP